MEMFNKLKSHITNVLPGNPLGGEFDMLTQRASGGQGLLWKIYDGTKKTTKQEVSIFVFEKKLLERYSRRDRELIIEVLRKGVSQLTRLRHPKILSVLHPLEEKGETLAFATEPIFASLSNVLGRKDNLPSPPPKDLQDFKLYDVEIKYGLLQVTEGLKFLHNDVRMVHNNVCPESVFINKEGGWKLGGFDCCINNANQNDQTPYYPCREWDSSIPPVIQPSLNYLAPEFALSASCDTASDMYSFGVLFYAIFSNGKTFFDCHEEYSAYKKNCTELRKMKASVLGPIPADVRDHIKMLLNAEPTVRPDADQLSQVDFFQDVGAMTLLYIDSLVQQDNLQKSQYFKGLPNVVAKLPKRVCLQRILPCLMKECINNNMIPFVLPNVMQIAEMTTEKEFAQQVLPSLIPVFKIQNPVQITLIFLQNMNLLLSKTPQSDIRNHVLPMVYRALEADSAQIQQLCLNIIPTFASLVEYSSMKSALVPRIQKLCLSTQTLSIRVNCLVCLGKLLEYMDKWYVIDTILPILQTIPSREPAVLMSILGIYQVTMTHKKLGLTKDAIAQKVLPFLFPLCIENNLNLSQFNAFMAVIKEMIQVVEKEHRGKLEQLNSIQQEQRTLQQFAQDAVQGTEGIATGGENKEDTMMDKFLSGLGVGNFFGANSGVAAQKPSPSPSNGSLNQLQMNEVPMPRQQDTQLPNKPAKVQLTMEEKSRLARDQELTQRLKSQQPLNPKANSQPSAAKTQPKDLTSSLLNSDFMNASKKPVSQTSVFNSTSADASSSYSMGTGGLSSSSTGFSTGTGSIFASRNSTMGTSAFSNGSGFNSTMSSAGIGGSTFSSQAPTGVKQNLAQTGSSMNMSSLDNLLPSQPKLSMAQMAQSRNPPPVRPQGMGMMNAPVSMGSPMMMGNQQGMMGYQQGMMGNQQGMMGNAPGMMGNAQRMLGNQQGMMGNPQGMMGGMRMQPMPMGGQNMMQASGMMRNQNTQHQATSNLSSQDIDDLLS